MANLFSPIQIRSIELKNRIVVSPMCQYSSEDGFANDWHFVHLGSRAVGGAALVIAEASAVSPQGRITSADLGIWKDEHIEPLKKITRFIQQQNAQAGIQLAHAGRKASHTEPWNGNLQVSISEGGWQTVAPSATPFSPADELPVALSYEEINQIIVDFGAAAKGLTTPDSRSLKYMLPMDILLMPFYLHLVIKEWTNTAVRLRTGYAFKTDCGISKSGMA